MSTKYDEGETIDFTLSKKDLIINWALVATLVAGIIYLGVAK